MNEIADVIDRAADLMFMYGRARGSGRDDTGRVCAIGAVCLAEGRDVDNPEELFAATPASVAVRDWVRAHTGHRWTWWWNDQTDDDGEIIDGLRACAKDLRR